MPSALCVLAFVIACKKSELIVCACAAATVCVQGSTGPFCCPRLADSHLCGGQ